MSLNNASDLLVKILEQEGVEFIYGIPGEENLYLLEAIRKSKIKLILTRHEQGAAFMAATYGRLTGKIGVALSTLGPGATNFTTAAAYATLGGFPLLLITGQKPIKQSKQGKFQIIDVVSMMKPICKYSQQIIDVNMLSSTLTQALKIAKEEKMGCVHIELPEDISNQKVDNNTPFILPNIKPLLPTANATAINQAATLINKALFPLVLIGSCCNRTGLTEKITNFINTTELPFFTTQMGKGVVSDQNPNYIGTTALSSGDYIHEAIKKADLIITLGTDIAEKPAFFVENQVKIIHINYTPATIDNIYNPSIEILGDIGNSVETLGKSLNKCNQDFSYAKKVKNFLEAHISKHDNDESFPIKPQKLVRDIQKVMSAEDYITLDNGMYKLWFARNYKSLQPNSLLLDNALATMGAGLPSAIEIARLHPNKKVLAVVGDGGFMMNSQELETALRLKVNLVVLILNDGSYGMIRWKQSGGNFNDFGLTFNNPNFTKYAEAYGAKGVKILKTQDLIPTLQNCFNEGGVHIVDIAIDYSENKKVLLDELQNKEVIQ